MKKDSVLFQNYTKLSRSQRISRDSFFYQASKLSRSWKICHRKTSSYILHSSHGNVGLLHRLNYFNTYIAMETLCAETTRLKLFPAIFNNLTHFLYLQEQSLLSFSKYLWDGVNLRG